MWLRERDFSVLIDMFDRATKAGDSLIAGELFDVFLEIVNTGEQRSQQNDSSATTWKRRSQKAREHIESILNNPMLNLQSQLILGRKVLVIIDPKLLEEANNHPIIPSEKGE